MQIRSAYAYVTSSEKKDKNNISMKRTIAHYFVIRCMLIVIIERMIQLVPFLVVREFSFKLC